MFSPSTALRISQLCSIVVQPYNIVYTVDGARIVKITVGGAAGGGLAVVVEPGDVINSVNMTITVGVPRW